MRTKRKSFALISGMEEGFSYVLRAIVADNGNFHSKGTSFGIENMREYGKKNREKDRIRTNDRVWVYRNIPSSIHWHTEIHHNWAKNGIMYLLTKGEHILRHRSEKG